MVEEGRRRIAILPTASPLRGVIEVSFRTSGLSFGRLQGPPLQRRVPPRSARIAGASRIFLVPVWNDVGKDLAGDLALFTKLSRD